MDGLGLQPELDIHTGPEDDQDDGVGSVGEDARAKLWEEVAVAGADGAAALEIGRAHV